MRLSIPHATTFLILLPFLSGVLGDPQLPLPAQSGFRRAQHLRKKDLLGDLLGGGTTASEANAASGGTTTNGGGLDNVIGGLVGGTSFVKSLKSLASLPSSVATVAANPKGVVTTGLITASAQAPVPSSAIPLASTNAIASTVNGTLPMNAASTSDSEPLTSTYVVVVQATPTSRSSTAASLNSSGGPRREVGAGWAVALGALSLAVLA